jgi:hypothetical protein
LTAALRYGAAPLKADAYTQALTYQKLLLGQLARLEVVCAEPGAQLFLDGELVLTGPGRRELVRLPGSHQLVASKPAFLTATREVTLVGGAVIREALQPLPMPQAVRTERRWAAWTPWAVVATGAAVALAGVPLQLAAGSSIDEYRGQVAEDCPAGCNKEEIPEATRDLERRAHLQNGLAIGLFATGSAAVATGLVLVLLNQPRPVAPGRVAITPDLSGGRVGLVVAGRF